MTYDPKLLEAYFRFMAEAARQQSQSSELMEAFANAASPDAWAEALRSFAPKGEPDPDLADAWQRPWEIFGFVPKAKYDELEAQYLALKERLETAEREAQRAKRLSAEGQEAQAAAALERWSETVQTALEAQSSWWAAWLDSTPSAASSDESDPP